jgi:hypothetical protein
MRYTACQFDRDSQAFRLDPEAVWMKAFAGQNPATVKARRRVARRCKAALKPEWLKPLESARNDMTRPPASGR